MHWGPHCGSPWLFSTVLVYFGGNKPSGLLPAVTARLLRVLYSEGNSDEWEQSRGWRSSWHSLYSRLDLFSASFLIALCARHVHRECRACLETGRPLTLSDSIFPCSSWATLSPLAFLPAFHTAYSSPHASSSPFLLLFLFFYQQRPRRRDTAVDAQPVA